MKKHRLGMGDVQYVVFYSGSLTHVSDYGIFNYLQVYHYFHYSIPLDIFLYLVKHMELLREVVLTAGYSVTRERMFIQDHK